MNIDFNKEEAVLIQDMLTKAIHEIKIEISHTSHREFKELLKEREKLEESLLEKIKKLA